MKSLNKIKMHILFCFAVHKLKIKVYFNVNFPHTILC